MLETTNLQSNSLNIHVSSNENTTQKYISIIEANSLSIESKIWYFQINIAQKILTKLIIDSICPRVWQRNNQCETILEKLKENTVCHYDLSNSYISCSKDQINNSVGPVWTNKTVFHKDKFCSRKEYYAEAHAQ